jgi:hypothetical protein
MKVTDTQGREVNLSRSLYGIVPIGGIIPWNKSYTGTPSLPVEFAECNGQSITDPASPFTSVPNLNGSGGGTPKRFLRGSTTSTSTGGAETHSHSFSYPHTHDLDPGVSVSPDYTAGVANGSDNTVAGATLTGALNVTETDESGPAGSTNLGSSLPSYYEIVWIMRIK